MWQPCVEIKDYSIAYFDCIAVFKVPYCGTFIKGEPHTRFVDLFDILGSTKARMSPALNKS